MKLKIILFSYLMALLIMPFMALTVNAGDLADDGDNALITPASNTQTKTSLENPLGSVTSISQLYGRIIYAFLGLSGAVALVMFILGGFSWMTAGGNEEKVKKGRDTLIWASLGLVVIFSSYAVLKTIFETLDFSGK